MTKWEDIPINLEQYPIIRDYAVYPTNSFSVRLRKKVETREEFEQFIEFIDRLHDRVYSGKFGK